MRSCNVIYRKCNWDGFDLFPNSKSLVWPAMAFRILIAGYPQRNLNFFELTLLRLLQIKSCNIEILCRVTCLREGFVRLILRRLRGRGLVKDFVLTDTGKDVLNNTMNEAPVIQNAFVFADCMSGTFYPVIASQLNMISAKQNGDMVTFRLSKTQGDKCAQIVGKVKRCNRPTLEDILNILHQFNKLCQALSTTPAVLYQDLPQYIEISKDTPELVWLYTEVRLGRNNHRIYISDPFLDLDSELLDGNMCSQQEDDATQEQLNRIIDELKQTGIDVNNSASDKVIDRYSSISDLVRPLDMEDHDKVQIGLSEYETMERLSDFYYALEQAFKRMLDAFDYSELVKSVSSLESETFNTMLRKIAVNQGMLPIERQKADLHHCDNKIDDSGKPWLKIQTDFKDFFDLSGSRLQDCSSGEANLRVWIALALLISQKRQLPAIRRLKLQHPDFLLFVSFLTPYRNNQNHGDSSVLIPYYKEMEECLKKTKEIVGILLPDLDISPETDQEMADLDAEKRVKAYFEAEYQLSQTISYARMRKLPKDVKEHMIMIIFHSLRKNKFYVFSHIMAIDSLMFRILCAERLPRQVAVDRAGREEVARGTKGTDVLNKAKRNFPGLADVFWEILPWKLEETLSGKPLSLRANLLCLLAYCDHGNHRKYFNKERLSFLEDVLRLRAHNWQDLVSRQPFETIEQLGKQAIEFTISIIEEYNYGK